MAFSVVESLTPTAFATAGTSHLVAMPAVVNSGDLLITGFAIAGVSAVTNPSGWNQLHSTDNVGLRLGNYYRIADGTEDGTTVDFVSGSSVEAVAHVYRISTWHGTTPPEIGTAATGNSVNPDSPSLTPSWGAADTLWIAIFANAGNVAISTYPTNYTNGTRTATAAPGAVTMGSARRELNATSDDPGVFTVSPSSEWVAQTLAIRPAASGTSHTRTVSSIVVSTLVDA